MSNKVKHYIGIMAIFVVTAIYVPSALVLTELFMRGLTRFWQILFIVAVAALWVIILIPIIRWMEHNKYHKAPKSDHKK